MKRLLFSILVGLAPLAACDTGAADDVPDPIDAPPGDGSGSGIDAPNACILPSTIITCTVGNDAPCTAQCAGAFCYNFNQVGSVCTNSCTPGGSGECPTGWTCNNMSRCRPPN